MASSSTGGNDNRRLILKEGVSVFTGGNKNIRPNVEYIIDNICTGRSGVGMLLSGQGIKHGGRIYSESREYYLTLEQDGSVVLYRVAGIDDTERVTIWSTGTPEQPKELFSNNKTSYENFHGPFSLVMQHNGNLVLRYSREHCILPASITTASDGDGGNSTIPSSSTRMVSAVTGFVYWVEDETDVILYPKIEEYSLGISNTENHPGATLVVTDGGQIIVRGVLGEGSNQVLWRRGLQQQQTDTLRNERNDPTPFWLWGSGFFALG